MSLIDFPQIRVGIDWNNKFDIDYDDLIGDPLNTFSNNGILRDDQAQDYGGVSWGVIVDNNEYSPFAYRVSSGGTGTRGIAFSTRTNYYTTPTVPGTFQGGDFTIPAAGTYTLSVMIKRDTSDVNLTMEVYDATRFNTGTGGVYANIQQISTSTWTRMNISFTASGGSYPRALQLRISQVNNLGFRVSYRASLVSGSTALVKFNNGILNPYDDITADVMAFNCRLGRSDPETLYPSEGELRLTLNNSTRKYSPENTLSPLYGLMKKNRRVVVEVKNPVGGAFFPIFTGWVQSYDPKPMGTRGNLQTEIVARQGMFRFDETKVSKLGITSNVTLVTLLEAVLPYGYLPGNVQGGQTDRDYLDKSTVARTMSDLRMVYTPINTWPLAGDGWGEETTAGQVIREVLEVERGFFWINRYGKIEFYNRYYPVGLLLQDTFSLDTNVTDAAYNYGGDVYNVIKVSYFPKSYTSGSVWTTKSPILVNRVAVKQVDVKFEYTEGSDITVSALNIPGSTITAKTRNGTVLSPSSYEITAELKNGGATLTIHNYSGLPAFFTIDLHGTIVTSFGSQTYYSELSNNSINAATYIDEGKREKSFSNKLISTEDDAIQIGDYLLARYGLPRSRFKSFKVEARNSTWLQRQIEFTLGSNIKIDEFQTNFTQTVIVVGIEHVWHPGMLETTFTVTPPEFYTIDVLTGSANQFYVGY